MVKPQFESEVDPPPPIILDKGGGFVEISSKNYLKRANVEGVTLNGGTLLLDPRFIVVNSSGTRTLSDVSSFSNGSSSTYYINASTISNAITAGTNVVLQANRDITISSAITAGGSSGGDLTMQAGRRININQDITTANGDLILTANHSSASNVGSSSKYITGSGDLNVGTGSITISMSNGQPAITQFMNPSGDMTANSITVNASNGSGQGNITLNGTLTAANTISVTNSATSTQSFSAGSLIANAASNPLIVISPQLGSISSISNSPNGNWKLVQTRNADVTVNNVPAANFVQYAYSGGSISGSGNAILSAYDPGTITKTFANVGGGTHQVRKTYDGTNSTSSATFGSDSLNDPLNVNLNLNSPTFTYSQANVGTSLTVTANAAYSINPVHSKHGTVYGLATSGSANFNRPN